MKGRRKKVLAELDELFGLVFSKPETAKKGSEKEEQAPRARG